MGSLFYQLHTWDASVPFRKLGPHTWRLLFNLLNCMNYKKDKKCNNIDSVEIMFVSLLSGYKWTYSTKDLGAKPTGIVNTDVKCLHVSLDTSFMPNHDIFMIIFCVVFLSGGDLWSLVDTFPIGFICVWACVSFLNIMVTGDRSQNVCSRFFQKLIWNSAV